jgi:hypothetical protein
MNRSPDPPAAASAATMPVPVPAEGLASVPPARGYQVPAGNGAVSPAVAMLRMVEDHDRIARGLNDIVVRRLFAAGLDLHAALGILGDHRAADRISHAIGELDHAIRGIRDTIFDGGAPRQGAEQG